jgi:hypothetical protein
MKKKLLGDILIYFVTPFILFSLFKGQDKIYSIMIITMLTIAYSIIIRYNQERFNLSGILFSSIYVIMQSLKVSLIEPYHIYIYDIYCLLLISIIIIITNQFNKNIFRQLYIDILKTLNLTQIQIANTIKKNSLYKDFYKIASIVNVHILTLVLIKIHAAFSLGENGYLNNLYMEVFTCIIFVVFEAITVVNFAKKIKVILSSGKLKNIKFISPESKIINFDRYKNLNK